VATDVLEQGSAERDVQKLVAATDRQHRQVTREGGIEKTELEFVAGRVELLDLRVTFLAVAGGVHVVAAGKDERIAAIEAGGRAFEVDGFEAGVTKPQPVTLDVLAEDVLPAGDAGASKAGTGRRYSSSSSSSRSTAW
jgi:hypothetical protein